MTIPRNSFPPSICSIPICELCVSVFPLPRIPGRILKHRDTENTEGGLCRDCVYTSCRSLTHYPPIYPHTLSPHTFYPLPLCPLLTLCSLCLCVSKKCLCVSKKLLQIPLIRHRSRTECLPNPNIDIVVDRLHGAIEQTSVD